MMHDQCELSAAATLADEQVSERNVAHSHETVSVVIPCYNEANFIYTVLENLAEQYDSECYEIIIVDGQSNDLTREKISAFKANRPELVIRVLENPARAIPVALNIGVESARGEIIARMDAHAIPSRGYIRRCVQVLQSETAGVVGMPCRVTAGVDTRVARSIAAAVSNPFGIGDAKYRLGVSGPPQEPVDTVAFACFRKSLWTELGGFNESLHTNEDYDFNYRVRASGRQVILDRAGYCDYFARTTISGLAIQYWRYGGWKAEMIRLQPKSTKFRHLVAPAFVISILILGILGFLWHPAWWLLLIELTTYFCFALVAGIRNRTEQRPMIVLMPVVFATIHLCWGTSFLFRLFNPRVKSSL